jgi:hypothetical protein
MFLSKQASSFPGRVFYHSGGGVRFAPFLVWLLLAIVAAVLLALLLLWLFLGGYYYVIIVPMAAALGVGALVRLAVVKGHCRNWLLGGFAGLCAAVVLYFGYFYGGMIYHWGPRAVARLDLLPAYIKARMNTDVIQDQGRPKESATRDTGGNWFFFSLETGLVLLVGAFSGIQRSRRPYCEACGQWMTRHVTSFSPQTSAAVMDALRNGSSQALAALCATPVYSSVPNVTVGIDLCPSLQEGGSRGCPMYVSVKQVTQFQGVAGADPIDQAKGKLLLRTLQATSSEMAALAPRFKLLESLTGRSTADGPLPATAANLAQAGPPIEIKAVEPEYAGKVLSRSMVWGGVFLAFIPLLIVLGGAGVMAWAASILDGTISPAEKLMAFGMIGAGIICMVGGAIMGLRNPGYIFNKIVQKRLRRELARRPICMVNPDNPEAFFVEIVPKANWARLMLHEATDVGLLLLDQAKRELLFEGDRERFRIPADALTYCGVEEFVYQQGHSKIRKYYAVLRIESPTQFWEAPIRLTGGAGLGGKKRKKEITLMSERVQQMRAAGKPAATV